MDKTSKLASEAVVPVKLDDLPSAKKTMDLFSKAREALNNPESSQYKNNILNSDYKDSQKVREIQPKRNARNALWNPPNEKTSDGVVKSPKSPKPEIPFSKNRYEKAGENIELVQENKKKAIKFLKKQKEEKAKKEKEKRKLIEKKREYTEQVRRLNKERLKKLRKRNSSGKKDVSETKRVPHSTSIRSKSEELKRKSYGITRRYARNRSGPGHHSEAKRHKTHQKRNCIKTLSVEDEDPKNTIDHQLERIDETYREMKQPPRPKVENRVSISVNLAGNMHGSREGHPMAHIENSEQKNSIEEEDTKYIKTPELNMNEKYSHKHSDNKLSAHSTEKEVKKSTRCHSSQKKKSIKVAKEIQECKKDLIKMQKLSEIRKRKVVEESDVDRDIERRKHNLETLNEMLRKRNE